jgi:Rrf2 family protein
MISQTAEYALRAAVVLATESARSWSREELARITKVPSDYLSKVLQSMARAKVVTSVRGAHGGFKLSRAPDSISLLDIVNAVDPLERIRTCPLGIRSHGINLCPLHRRLDQAYAMVEKAFRASSLAELTLEASGSGPRPCDFPFKPLKKSR